MGRVICIHYYASEKIKEKLLLEVINPVVRELHNKNVQAYITRDWKYGPHIEIIYEESNSVNEAILIEKLKCDVKKFQDKNGYNKEFNKEDYLKVVKDIAKIERVKDYKPIRDQGYIASFECDLEKKTGEYSSVNEKRVFTKYNFMISEYMIELLEKMYYMNYKERVIYFAKCLAIAATNYPEYGARKGYLSFASHSEGFLGNKRKETQIYRDRFAKFHSLYKEEAQREVRKVIMSYRNDNLNEEDEIIYGINEIFKKFVVDIRNVIEMDKQNNDDMWISYSKRKVEVGKRFKGQSKFHTGLLNSNRNFSNFIVSDDFNTYRLLINFVYNQTPLIGFSSSTRMLSCYECYRAIEFCYGESWERLIKEK